MVAPPYVRLHQDDSQFESYSKTKIKKKAVRSTIICLLLTFGILSFLIPVCYKLMEKRASRGKEVSASHLSKTTENIKNASFMAEHHSVIPPTNSFNPAAPSNLKTNLTKSTTATLKIDSRRKVHGIKTNFTLPRTNVSKPVTRGASFLDSTSEQNVKETPHSVHHSEGKIAAQSDWLQWRRQKFEAFQWLVELYADSRYHYTIPIILGAICAIVCTLSVWTVIIMIKKARRVRRKAQLGRLVNNLQDNNHTLSSDSTSEEDV